jgi:hypothetical protein
VTSAPSRDEQREIAEAERRFAQSQNRAPVKRNEPSRSLDYATRKLIADTVAEEIRGAASFLQVAEPTIHTMHGPSSVPTERLVLSAVLAGNATCADLGLAPEDFWPTLHQRYWLALTLDAQLNPSPHSPVPASVVAALSGANLISGPLEDYVADLEAIRSLQVFPQASTYDLTQAAAYLRQLAAARRLKHLLLQLAGDLTSHHASAASAYAQLRAHFAAERARTPA